MLHLTRQRAALHCPFRILFLTLEGKFLNTIELRHSQKSLIWYIKLHVTLYCLWFTYSLRSKLNSNSEMLYSPQLRIINTRMLLVPFFAFYSCPRHHKITKVTSTSFYQLRPLKFVSFSKFPKKLAEFPLQIGLSGTVN